MSIISNILILLVALEFFYICYLQTFATTSNTIRRVFHIPTEKLRDTNIQTLFKNQGVYNGLIGILLCYTVFFAQQPKELATLLLLYIIAVAVYGSITSDKSIIFKQGGLAILALFSLFL